MKAGNILLGLGAVGTGVGLLIYFLKKAAGELGPSRVNLRVTTRETDLGLRVDWFVTTNVGNINTANHIAINARGNIFGDQFQVISGLDYISEGSKTVELTAWFNLPEVTRGQGQVTLVAFVETASGGFVSNEVTVTP